MVPLRVTVAQPNCLPEFAKQIKAEITIAFLTQILGQGQLSNCPGRDDQHRSSIVARRQPNFYIWIEVLAISFNNLAVKLKKTGDCHIFWKDAWFRLSVRNLQKMRQMVGFGNPRPGTARSQRTTPDFGFCRAAMLQFRWCDDLLSANMRFTTVKSCQHGSTPRCH